jgi:parallel beta-helix repeat protein
MGLTDGVSAALVGLLLASCTLAIVTGSAHGAEREPAGKRAALTRILLSASESTRGAQPGAIVEQSFANGLDALVVTRDATMLDLQANAPETVVELRPGVWELRKTVLVASGATLSIDAPAVRELRLLSTPSRFASIIARSANLEFKGLPHRRLLVRSWDPGAGRPDRVLGDGRATVAVRGQGRLDASNATFARLGFYMGTVSGFALWAHGNAHGTGTVRQSRFVDNYNGAYSFGARKMRWIANRFVHNRVYGFDPHTGSNGFLVRGNYAAWNGRHGIIFSNDCNRNVIRGNVSEHNRWHGIVLDDGKHGNRPSNFNVVTDNVVRDNAGVGIQIDGSAHNRIRGNRIIGSRQGVRIIGPANDNVITRNSIRAARDFGVILHFPSRRTAVTGNRISDTPTGLRVHGSSLVSVRRNRIERVVSHAVKVDDAARGSVEGVVIAGNRLQGSGTSPVRIATRDEDGVATHDNEISWDYPLMRDVARLLQSRVGPGLWLLLFLVVLAGPLLVAFFQRLPPGRRSRAGA